MYSLYMEVRDTGIGIKEDQKFFFDSFSRMDIVRNCSIEVTHLYTGEREYAEQRSYFNSIPNEKIEWRKELNKKVGSCEKDEMEDLQIVEHQTVSDNTTFASMQINEEIALENMGNQRELFKELLEYCLELEEQRKQEIIESYEAQDWTEYAIRVHSLKGGMRSLGVEELALVAQEQERATKENRIEDVVNGHINLMNEYDRGHRSIEEYLKTFQI